MKSSPSTSLFGSSGIRGRVNELITGPFAIQLGLATADLLRNVHAQPSVIVGHDHRTSSPMLAAALTSGLLTGGCQVTSAGLAPTPTIAFAAKKHKMDAAIIVTASHNPPEYNGFKFHNPDGAGFSLDQQEKVQGFLKTCKPVGWEEFGSILTADFLQDHIDAIVEACTISQPHKVVFDAALGVGGLVTPIVLDHFAINVKSLNISPSGKDYARGIPPSKLKSAAAAEWEHFVRLDDLCATVKKSHAEVGLAHDGDADRLLAIDDKGRLVAGDLLLALMADYYLASRGGKVVVTTVSSSSIVDYIAKKHDARVVRCRVGDVFVSNLVKKHNAILGAEPSGPFIFPELHHCPDGPLAACKILELLEWAKRSLSILVDELPTTYLLRASIACPNDVKQIVMETVTMALDKWQDIEDITQVDGVRVNFTDASWVLVRPSGTEPLIRITVEALSSSRAKNLITQSQKLIHQAIP